MHGEALDDLGPRAPHLVHLRWKLDEVARNGRAGETRIRHVREHAVQRVSELVEERGHLCKGEERRVTLFGLRHVEVVGDDRLPMEQARLPHVRVHPSAPALRRASVGVQQEEREQLA